MMREPLPQGMFWTPRPLYPAVGQLRSIHIPNPGVGNQWEYRCPPGKLAHMVCGSGELNNHQYSEETWVGIVVKDGNGNIVWEGLIAELAKYAGIIRLSWAAGITRSESEVYLVKAAPIPPLVIGPSWSIASRGVQMSEEAHWENVYVVVEEFDMLTPEHHHGEPHHVSRNSEHPPAPSGPPYGYRVTPPRGPRSG